MARRRAATGGGTRVAEEELEKVDEKIEQLQDRLGVPHGGGAAEEPNDKDATIYYFAFGSNMAKKVFSGRRMIQPAESFPAVLHGYKLTFHQPGLPYREPGFATVMPSANGVVANGTSTNGVATNASTQPDVHGVVHRITPRQYNYVLETEGGANQADNESGYKVLEVEVERYDGRKVTAYTLTTHPSTIARLRGRNALPSKRYLTIIREGAVESGLDPTYRAWLDTLDHYEARTLGQKLGALLFTGIAALVVPLFAVLRLYRKLTGMREDSLNAVVQAAFRTWFQTVMVGSWWLHELLRPLLGCGVGNALPRKA